MEVLQQNPSVRFENVTICIYAGFYGFIITNLIKKSSFCCLKLIFDNFLHNIYEYLCKLYSQDMGGNLSHPTIYCIKRLQMLT